jgi:SAM-dependent methyltransferase
LTSLDSLPIFQADNPRFAVEHHQIRQLENILEVNARANRLKGLGPWRTLYRELLARLPVESVLEVGSGDPAFLASLPAGIRRVAIDGNPTLAPLYRAAGIEFHSFDFDREIPPTPLRGFDTVVCSDVFEHLLYPQRTLQLLTDALAPAGFLLSHVPNEFQLWRAAKVMLGLSGSVCFHPECDEWENPHLRRFSDFGYRRFLTLSFPHNLKITDLEYTRLPRLLHRIRVRVPYFLEGGPTYASTKDEERSRALVRVKSDLERCRGTWRKR